ncbi:MAG: DUF3168 domain-containing protein [Rhizobiales bacterium]|nr:DUF3168 domain-containing protein [Hyphomicrobiales bacterium]
MSPAPGWALQRALFETLVAAPGVLSILGGARIHDHVPRNAERPYVVFANASEIDAGTSECAATEHVLTLDIWSDAPGRRQALSIAAAIRDALETSSPALVGHHLVDLRQVSTTLTPDQDGGGFRASMRWRAVTEPL